MTNHQIAEVAHWIGLIPLVVLTGLSVFGRVRDRGYWLLATAFALSWVADTAAHRVDPLLVSIVYLGSQAGLIAITLLPRLAAAGVVVLLTVTGFIALSIRPAGGRDVLQHTVAWLAVCLIVLPAPELGAVRWTVGLGFAGMLVAWLWYVAAWPSFPAWYAMQGVRLAMLGGFSLAAWKPVPTLRLV